LHDGQNLHAVGPVLTFMRIISVAQKEHEQIFSEARLVGQKAIGRSFDWAI